jgi:sarcosine oxidase subunit beta
LDRIVLVEKGVVGAGASHRAAGMVRAQGGSPLAVRLWLWSERFYLGQAAEIGVDSGFVEQGCFIPAFTAAEVEAGEARVAMQQSCCLPGVTFLDRMEAERLNPTFAHGACLAGSHAPGDGYRDPAGTCSPPAP